MVRQDNKSAWASAGWIALGAALGIAAFAALRRGAKGEVEFFDVESVLEACDLAAQKLENLLTGEPSSNAV